MVGVTCRDQCSTASLQKMMGWELGLPGLFCGGRDSFYGGWVFTPSPVLRWLMLYILSGFDGRFKQVNLTEKGVWNEDSLQNDLIQDHMVHNWLEKFDIIFHLYCVPICPCFKAFLQRGDGVDGVMGVLTGLKAGVSKSDVCCITPTVDGSEILQQMKLVVYPIIHGVLYMPGDCLGFLTYQQYVSWLFSKTCQRIMSTPCLVRMTLLLK